MNSITAFTLKLIDYCWQTSLKVLYHQQPDCVLDTYSIYMALQ